MVGLRPSHLYISWIYSMCCCIWWLNPILILLCPYAWHWNCYMYPLLITNITIILLVLSHYICMYIYVYIYIYAYIYIYVTPLQCVYITYIIIHICICNIYIYIYHDKKYGKNWGTPLQLELRPLGCPRQNLTSVKGWGHLARWRWMTLTYGVMSYHIVMYRNVIWNVHVYVCVYNIYNIYIYTMYIYIYMDGWMDEWMDGWMDS